jgi:hypothetical protein
VRTRSDDTKGSGSNKRHKGSNDGGKSLTKAENTACRNTKYCIHFNKGSCSSTGDHDFETRNGNTLKLLHKCAKCDKDSHGLHNHTR